MYVAKRSHHNPVLIPERQHPWEAIATFNWSPIKKGKNIHVLYRAISYPDPLTRPESQSTIGHATTTDGIHYKDKTHFIYPENDWEKFGCEDPRVTLFEGKYYTFYTALSEYPFNANGIKVAVAVSDDLKSIKEKHLVTPFNAKAMALFPERINGKITVIFSYHTDMPPAHIAIAQCNKIEELWSVDFWENWQKNIDKNIIQNIERTVRDHVEVGAVPIKTKLGWLFIYSHIQNYFEPMDHDPRIFGIEALLFDLKNPQKIIGRTEGPILVPEEPYELSGFAPNIVFPSGALVEKDILHIYYGAADTTCCRANIVLSDLLKTISFSENKINKFVRFKNNPIISPNKDNAWEATATFNPAAIMLGNKIHILYRTLANDNTSYIGYAVSKDGLNIDERLQLPIYSPRESFETKKIPNGNSGCEDPRLIKIGSLIYMCYTAFDSIGPPRVAVTSISEKDFLKRNWVWSKPVILTPNGIDDKDTCFLPEKIDGKYMIMHRIGTDICADYIKTLDFEKDKVMRCIKVLGPRINSWDSSKVGITAPPIKTKYGWLLLYHGVSRSHSTYRVGAVLLSLKDPTIVLSRITDPIFEPETDYEKVGIVNNVVFPCGMVVKKGVLFIYYGGADKVTGVATIKLDIILQVLKRGIKL
ncbi:hypothetical protein IT400_02545 [Candidatus Nomurabacteria bacterium]|nr:hypothetical protein [Candidatus Nomurabacteria bacterium]